MSGAAPADELATEAATGGSGTAGLSSVPESVRGAVERAVAVDFAWGMRAVLIGMVVALAVAFLVALRREW